MGTAIVVVIFIEEANRHEVVYGIACRTGVIFCVFQGIEASARRARVACEGRMDFLAILPSHATRARLAFASSSVRQKYAKAHACSAGYLRKGPR